MGLSGLRKHLFKIKVVTNPLCQYCHDEIEDPCHYLVRCPYFFEEQTNMFSDLINLVNVQYWNGKTENEITSILVSGDILLSFETNRQIHNRVVKYIEETKRFNVPNFNNQ